MSNSQLVVEIWSDIICPWCGLGLHRLEKAIAQFEQAGGQVSLVHRSFQLDPSFPKDEVVSTTQLLTRKYGMSEAQVQESTAQIEGLAEKDGLSPYRVGNNSVGNTQKAHELAAFASAHGREDAVWKKLYSVYFGEQKSIFMLDALVEIGMSLGFSAEEVRDVLTSGRYAEQVTREGREASMLGAKGVPFVVINRKFGVSGAQSTETFLRALQQAATA